MDEQTQEKYVLGDDLPKRNPWREDRLGHAPFAQRIARVIIGLSAPNGYVIALHGRWGSGKSTVINFILEYLNKHNEEHEHDRLVHVEFRPWIVSARHDLIAAFFKILSETLGPDEGRIKRTYRKLLRFVHGSTDNLVDAAAKIALAVEPSSAAASVAGSLAKKSIDRMINRFLEEPSLQKAYDDLRLQLARSGKRFLVTIDDIDRLEDSEVKAVMQMVKSIGQLPNVVYLLAYDRDIVSKALDRQRTSSEPRFSEKIVQQEIELPKPQRRSLLSVLDQEIAFLTASTDSSLRWHYIVRDGIHRWIRSPRDIVRLANAIKFSWPPIQGEIDPQDFLAMEGLRLFDEGVFNWARDNRDFFFGDGFFTFAKDEVKQATVKTLKDRIPESAQAQVVHLLAVLFPQSGKSLEGRDSFSEESNLEVLRRRGIASEAGYDAYFGLHPSADVIPRMVIKEIIARSDDIEFLKATIGSYLGKQNSQGKPLISLLLADLRVMFSASRPAQPTQALLDALFNVGDDILVIARDPDMFELPPAVELGFLIRSMLERWGEEQAGEHLVEAFEKDGSPALLSDIYVDRGRELGVFRSESSERSVISETAFGSLGGILLEKIRAAVDSTQLTNAPFFFDIVRAWSHLDSADKVREWLNINMTQSAEFMSKVGIGLVYFSAGTEGKNFSMKEAPDPNLYDVRVLVAAGKSHLQRNDLTADQRKVIAEIVRGSELVLASTSKEQSRS